MSTPSQALATVAEQVKAHPFIILSGVAAVLLLSRGRSNPPGELSDSVKGQLISADVATQQISANTAIQLSQVTAGLKAVQEQTRTGLQANLAGISASTAQAQIAAAYQTNIANIQKDAQLQLANIADAFQRYALPQQIDYWKSQDWQNFQIAKSTAPYVAQQNRYLVRHQFSPWTNTAYGTFNNFAAGVGQGFGNAFSGAGQAVGNWFNNWLNGAPSSSGGASNADYFSANLSNSVSQAASNWGTDFLA